MISIIIAILLAALAYWLCSVLGLPAVVGIIAAIVVLLAAAPLSGGFGGRFGRTSRGV
ncbi:MAG: hypothetical protein QOI80_2687 [Solirubrobacteraceae bacterium]|jgi:hypothetical protein|nr:hypothetical protein [Solirubrobacteraceae bacterium]